MVNDRTLPDGHRRLQELTLGGYTNRMPVSGITRSREAPLACFLWAVVVAVPWAPRVIAEPNAYAVPFVPSAANTAQQGFVRIINHSEESGDLRITPIDDAGRRYSTIRIHIQPLAAVHFNSLDLENGNSTKGLSHGVGPGVGDWRLEVEADFVFEALAYIRTPDGFVTSIFEAADWWDADIYWLPFFNPGSNRNQVSKLRLVNPKDDTANVVIVGIDDRGSIAPGGRVELSLAPRTSRIVTAEDLEEGTTGLLGRLGDGEGKWRLWIKSDRRLHVLGLLESPTGNLTNLSTGAWWDRSRAPMVLPATDPNRQAFVRVINNSRRQGRVEIRGVDDQGRRYGPVVLSIGSFATAHFNSTDLVSGNADKGLSAGFGTFAGNLRLAFETDLIITPLAYVRTVDGFVTSVHDLTLSNNADKTWVPTVNPGTNRNQQSLLRLVNLTDKDSAVEIWGRDDGGSYASGGTVSLSLPPNGARTITAQELEQGADGLAGRFGDGTGKWTLVLSSDERIEAMSLLNSPTGNLTNLSATPYTHRLRITNAPVAHDISLSTDLSSSYIQVQLMATDPDGDSVGFVLDGDSEGDGYQDAYVDWETGGLSATLLPPELESVRIPYRATDGYEWSDRAYVAISIVETEEPKGLGSQDVDPEEYARLSKAYFDPDIWSDYEDQTRSLPQSVDLSGNFPFPGNQGVQRSCVGWSVSYLKSYQERVEERWGFTHGTRFSPAWIYNQINAGRDEGSHPLHAMELIQARGAATWATMPYSAADYLTQPSVSAIEEARNYLGGAIQTIGSVQTYKAALAHRVPFVLGMPVHRSFHGLSGRNPVYNDLSGEPEGGHAVVVVGYDEDRFGGAFKVLNSWGAGWGDQGFFWLPYATFRDPKFSKGVYSITIADLTNGEVSRPVETERPRCGAIDEELANLTIASWEADYHPQQGGEGSWRWRVRNNGTATASAGVDVNLMLSEDRTINSADHWVIYEEIPFEILPGHEAHRDADNERRFKFPETIPPGTYYMAMWVDDLDEVEECDEQDNIAMGQNTIALNPTKPDLTATSWYAQWDDDGNGLLEYQVENIGTIASARTDWRITLLLHTHPGIDLGYRYDLFTEQVGHVLEPGGWVFRNEDNPAHFDLQTTIPGELVPAGVYYMTLWVDDLDHVDESNELNNKSASNGFVVLGAGASSLGDAPNPPFELPTKAARGERFNGHAPPNALTRRVEVVDNGNGTRRVTFLEPATPPEDSVTSRLLEPGIHPLGVRFNTTNADVRSFPKRNVSADIVTSPVSESRAMPQ